MAKILIVDDEQGMCVFRTLTSAGTPMWSWRRQGAMEVLALINARNFDGVRLINADGSGLDVVQAAHYDDPTTSESFSTAVGTLELAERKHAAWGLRLRASHSDPV